MTSLVASHDSRWIVTASLDDHIIVWDTSSGAVLHEWSVCQHGVSALALSPDSRRLVSADRHRTLIIWAMQDDGVQKVTALEGHADVVWTCAWSPDGAMIASGSIDGAVRVWDGHTFQQRNLFSATRGLRALQFSPDSRYLAWISDGDCCVWRPLVEEQPKRLPSHPDRSGVDINALSFDPESRRIATAHGKYDASDPDVCVVRVWDIATGAALAVLHGHSRAVWDTSFSPDGISLLSASADGSARIWDAESGEQMALFQDVDPDGLGVRTACFSPDGKYVATESSRMGRVQLWRLDDVLCVATVGEHGSFVECLTFTPCGGFVAFGDGSGRVYIRRLSDLIDN